MTLVYIQLETLLEIISWRGPSPSFLSCRGKSCTTWFSQVQFIYKQIHILLIHTASWQMLVSRWKEGYLLKCSCFHIFLPAAYQTPPGRNLFIRYYFNKQQWNAFKMLIWNVLRTRSLMRKYNADLLWLLLLVATIFDYFSRFANEKAIVILKQ